MALPEITFLVNKYPLVMNFPIDLNLRFTYDNKRASLNAPGNNKV